MPLRQSRLNFGSGGAGTDLASLPNPSVEVDAGESTAASSMECDADTIIVNISDTHRQLPTPSESATDVSSQSSQVDESQKMVKSKSKRVARARQSRFLEQEMDVTATDEEKVRSISGETLVAHSMSQSSLVQKGVKALDLPWNMSDVFGNGSKADLVRQGDESETGSIITVKEDHVNEEGEDEHAGDNDEEQEEQRAARKAKMEENAKRWEERRKAAEKNATRRSNRASLLDKATEIISGLTSSVLGKRSRDSVEQSQNKPSSTKTQSIASNYTRDQSLKKQRLNEKDIVHEQQLPKKQSLRKREKKWLVSGLYAGQVRTFDARLTETKNKRKSNQTEVPYKENTVMPLPMFAGERLLKQGRDFKLPFDVFSPLPAGQPKPDEWRKTNKNVFVGDAADEWRESKFVEQSTCLCQSETGCDHNCMNRYMYYECDDKNCNFSESGCENRAFAGLKIRAKIGDKYSIGVEVIKTADRGYGVRSNRTFDPNQIIVEYTGEIITQEECEHRMHTMYKDNECYYLMLFDQNMIIDATRGSIARFVNHSCEPNCRMEKWTVGGKPRMALFAGDRGIMTGEELTYDYNFDPYSQKNVQACHCGAETCRGFLGPKPKEVKRNSPDATENGNNKKQEGRLAGAKRKVAEVLGDSTNRLTKKRKIEATPTRPVKPATKSKHVKVKSPAKVRVVKKVGTKKVSISSTTIKKLGRSDSKLKKIVASVKHNSSVRKNARLVSGSSATEALISKDSPQITNKSGIGRSTSLKEKASNLGKSMAKSVRGRSKSMNVMVEAV